MNTLSAINCSNALSTALEIENHYCIPLFSKNNFPHKGQLFLKKYWYVNDILNASYFFILSGQSFSICLSHFLLLAHCSSSPLGQSWTPSQTWLRAKQSWPSKQTPTSPSGQGWVLTVGINKGTMYEIHNVIITLCVKYIMLLLQLVQESSSSRIW